MAADAAMATTYRSLSMGRDSGLPAGPLRKDSPQPPPAQPPPRARFVTWNLAQSARFHVTKRSRCMRNLAAAIVGLALALSGAVVPAVPAQAAGPAVTGR